MLKRVSIFLGISILVLIFISVFIALFLRCPLHCQKNAEKSWEILLPEILPSRVSLSRNFQIPKNMFFVYLTGDDSKDIHKPIFDNIQRWAKMHPSFHIKVFTDTSLANFIQKNYNKDVLKAYLKMKPYSFRCDLGRYCLLHHYGGVYIDLRISCGDLPVTHIFGKNDQFICPTDQNLVDGGTPLLPGFIASTPNHPYLLRAINKIVNNVEKNFYGKNAVHVTGPEVIGWAVSQDITPPFKSGQFGSTKILKFHHKKKRIYWGSKIVLRYKTVGGDEFNKFSGKGNCYWKMWRNKNIYFSDEEVSAQLCQLKGWKLR